MYVEEIDGEEDERISSYLEMPNGLLDFAECYYQTLFNIIHEMNDTRGNSVLKTIMKLSLQSFSLIYHQEFLWSVENVPFSCQLLPTKCNYISQFILYDQDDSDECRKMNVKMFSKLKYPMSIQNKEGRCVFVLDHPLRKNVFHLEYKIKEVINHGDFSLGCGDASYCPWPKKEIFGEAPGSACFTHSDMAASCCCGGRKKSHQTIAPTAGTSLYAKSDMVVGLEVDMRGTDDVGETEEEQKKKKKKERVKKEGEEGEDEDEDGGGVSNEEKGCLSFTVDGIPLKYHLKGLPDTLYYIVELFNPISVEFVSLSRYKIPKFLVNPSAVRSWK